MSPRNGSPAGPTRRGLTALALAGFGGLALGLRPATARESVPLPDLRLTTGARLDAGGPFRMVVDTGAEMSMLSQEVAHELGLGPAPPVRVHGLGGDQLVQTVRLVRVQVEDGAVWHDVRMAVVPRDRLGADGVLGMDVFGERRIELEFGRRRVRFHHPQTETPVIGATFDLHDAVTLQANRLAGSFLAVNCKVGGVRTLAVVDSGAQRSIGNPALVRALGAAATPLGEATVDGVAGGLPAAQVVSLDTLWLDRLRVAGLAAVIADDKVFQRLELADRPALLLGVDVLSRLKSVTLDPRRREASFVA